MASKAWTTFRQLWKTHKTLTDKYILANEQAIVEIIEANGLQELRVQTFIITIGQVISAPVGK